MSASASQCEAHVKSFRSGKKHGNGGDEDASPRQDDLFIVLQISTALRSLSQSRTQIRHHGHVMAGVCMHVGRAHETPWVQELAQNLRKRTRVISPPSSGVSCIQPKQCGRADSTYYTTSP